jgi:hypothetical protein
MALGSTRPLTEISTRKGPVRRAEILPPSCADCLEILGASTSWKTPDLSWPVQWLLYLTFRDINIHKLMSVCTSHSLLPKRTDLVKISGDIPSLLKIER